MAIIDELKIVTMDLSLRDLFAGQIIVALMGTDPAINPWLDRGDSRQLTDWVAKCAYDYADAMLKARNKKGEI